MKLCYRGVDYEYSPHTLEMTESEILGQYRGRSLKFQYVRHIPVPQPILNLQYRGVAYRTYASGQVEAPVHTAPAPDMASLEPTDSAVTINSVFRTRQALLREVAEIHRNSIRRSLEHRIEVAKTQGNKNLLHQLEVEMSQMA
ncbi:MAG: DUF4278 domain-containing protein [Cyanothece sp. SIO1E1]|nr:DUF4278 domain-containing protein [Cyanothece sp. SIO1E1]